MRYHRHNSWQRPKKKLLISGINPVIEAMKNGVEIEKIFLQKGIENRELRILSEKLSVPVSYVPEVKLKSFNVENHEGVIALRSKITYQNLQDVISLIVGDGKIPAFLLLDGITDIRNIGAIARTAYATGVDAIVLPRKGVGTLNEDAIATSAGALEQLTICRVNNLAEAIETLHLNGIQVLASEMTAKEVLCDLDLKVPVAIIMGSEDTGIDPGLYKMCDKIFQIPMKNGFESFNVSVATGMILYELMRQRLRL